MREVGVRGWVTDGHARKIMIERAMSGGAAVLTPAPGDAGDAEADAQ
jgi:hypothetical protein